MTWSVTGPLMINLYDIAYALGVGVSAPYWLARSKTRQKVLRALNQRMGREIERRTLPSPAVLIHAVSLGEINATSALVKLLRQARPDLDIIVSTTTDTGYDRGLQLYRSVRNVMLIRFPLDFTSALKRMLDRLRPIVIVLMELEIWPNLLLQCQRQHIPVVLVNGRMTEPAFKKYRLLKPVTAAMFRRIAAICAQDETYAQRFRQLGAPVDRLSITGTMKFDTAQLAERVEGDTQLAQELGLDKEPLWVCGSTGPGEESIILDVYRALGKQFPALRLAIVPRHPQRFDEVAALIAQAGLALLRRSTPRPSADNRPVILGDTMGELRKFYSLAGVVFVGRSLVDLGPRQHGSDMIEPAALAKAVVVGPWTHNFAEPMRKFREAAAVAQVSDAASLSKVIESWLRDPLSATATGRRAQDVVRLNQGATARHAEIILRYA